MWLPADLRLPARTWALSIDHWHSSQVVLVMGMTSSSTWQGSSPSECCQRPPPAPLTWPPDLWWLSWCSPDYCWLPVWVCWTSPSPAPAPCSCSGCRWMDTHRLSQTPTSPIIFTWLYAVGYFRSATSVSKVDGSFVKISDATSSSISSLDLPVPEDERACAHTKSYAPQQRLHPSPKLHPPVWEGCCQTIGWFLAGPWWYQHWRACQTPQGEG